MSLPIRLIAAAAAGLSLGACTVNNPPPASTAPAPVVVQPTPPSSGTVVVQPHTY